ncbi:MAG: hypothetical protein A2X56_11405 [Nitrospirae bacterium GWC2_57_13]|nr:MAG: hypothetical protein A2072_07975 [Nitrospirae bacterium GWC1_57_7]OGW27652.1 MAG: hypothetical protein A2X56_11405 [Nitrospirae bacterium GWC2_57_13]OGW42535.1 MAG: hypothetical protein A2X57_01535 [Nitrospirae bacterium GWD2_57_8]HAR46216.1 hypothetical protein [Nitrospiraceae bacterium]HAS55598.1 hypothetical protein [Nitrospiraceae bacterium]
MYENIIIGCDDSLSSKAAVAEAAQLVRNHGGKLTLAHAVYFDEEEFSNAPGQREKRFELGAKMCSERKGAVLSEFGVAADSIVCEGEPPEVLADLARERKADLVALGTYGRKGLNRLLMGSVTSGVILNAPCDVLVVKRPCSECNGRFHSILLPFDGSEFSKKALLRACELAKTDKATITALYVIPRYEEMVGFLRTEAIKQSLEQEAATILSSARKIAAEQGVAIATVTQEGSAEEKIVELSGRLKNDLIVMGSYGWRGVNKAIMGSTAERVIISASCPVLVVQ